MYFTEYDGNRVRRVDTEGVISTVAGTGIRGYSGDGGPATQAQISAPFGVLVDQYGYLYFTSAGNDVVRRVSPEGVIETIAGTGDTRYQIGRAHV